LNESLFAAEFKDIKIIRIFDYRLDFFKQKNEINSQEIFFLTFPDLQP